MDDESNRECDDTDCELSEDVLDHSLDEGLLFIGSGNPSVGHDGDDDPQADCLQDADAGRTFEDGRYEPVPDGLDDEAVPGVERNGANEVDDERLAGTFGRVLFQAGDQAHF